MNRIKHFVLPEHTNSLYENEALSSIWLTKKVASKINEIVDVLNEFSNDDIKWKQLLEGKINSSVVFMKDNLINSLYDLFVTLKNSGQIDSILTDVINNKIGSIVEMYDHVVNVKDYGATGNGVEDDSVAFQRAIDSGKYICIPDGTYKFNTPLIINSDTLLYGSSNNCILKCETNTDSMFDVRNCTLNCESLNINGNNIVDVIFKGSNACINLDNCKLSNANYGIKQESCSIDINSIVQISNTSFFTKNGIRYYGNEFVSFMLNDVYMECEETTYFIAECKHASVSGGEFTGSVNTMGNLYSNETASINGGYYHDMKRGATIGGRSGRTASIIGTINKNMSSYGLSFDFATGEPENPYTDGYGSIIGNIIENSQYGMYIQSKNTSITSNSISMDENGKFAIRLNCKTNADSGNFIANNIIHMVDDSNCNGIYLGDNTIVRENNNVIIGGVNHRHGGNGSVYMNNNIVNVSENYTIQIQDKIVVMNDLTADGIVYIKNPEYAQMKGQEVLVLNNTAHYVYISKRSNDIALVGSSNNKIPPHGYGKLICINENLWYFENVAVE